MRFAERMTMSDCVMWSRLLLQDAAETGLILFFFKLRPIQPCTINFYCGGKERPF